MDRNLFEADHDDFRRAVRTFVERHVVPNQPRWREEHQIDAKAWLEAGRHDFLGISMPADLGGSGVDDFRFNVVLTEELAAAGFAIASAFGIHVDVVAPYLRELGRP